MTTESALDQLREEMANRYSYLDVLALALARSGVNEFTGDSARWSEAVRNLRDKHPDLLAGIWFSERGYSEQLEDFFRVMARAGALSFANPRYERIDLATEAAERIKKDAPKALLAMSDKVEEIANALSELAYS